MAEKRMVQKLSEDEFIERFKPLWSDESGRFAENPAHVCIDLDVALKERRLWTVVKGDKRDILLQGSHYFNYVYNVICEVPYLAGEEIEVQLD